MRNEGPLFKNEGHASLAVDGYFNILKATEFIEDKFNEYNRLVGSRDRVDGVYVMDDGTEVVVQWTHSGPDRLPLSILWNVGEDGKPWVEAVDAKIGQAKVEAAEKARVSGQLESALWLLRNAAQSYPERGDIKRKIEEVEREMN